MSRRYISIVVLLINTVGYFARFSPATCARYFWVGPIFKGMYPLQYGGVNDNHTLVVTQTMLSQIILGIRYVYQSMFPDPEVPFRRARFEGGLFAGHERLLSMVRPRI